MISGLHAPNAPFTGKDYKIIAAAKARSVKVFATEATQYTFGEIQTLRGLGVTDILTRLPDSKKANGDVRGDDEWAHELAGTINLAHAQGRRVFSICNEPNWMHTRKGFGPLEYVWYIKRVVLRLRPLIPPDVILVSPPLSFSPALWHHDPPGTPFEQRINRTDFTLDEWLDAYGWKDEHSPNAEDRVSLWDVFDLAGATVYWQTARQMLDPSFGAGYRTVHERSGGKKVVVLEWASSAQEIGDGDGHPVYTPERVEALRLAQYPDWVEQAEASGIVVAAYCYLVGGTKDWKGFRISERLARVMAAVVAILPGLRGQSEWLGMGRGAL